MAMGLGFLGRGKERQITLLATFHILGGAVGGATVGWMLGWSGTLLHLEAWRLVVVGAAALFALWHGLRRYPHSLGVRRQVPRSWARTMPPTPRFFLWGLLLGSGIVVMIPYSAYLVLLAAQLTIGGMLGAISGAVFGGMRGVSALLLLASQEERLHPERLPALLPVLIGHMQRWNLLGILGGSLLLLIGGR